MVAASSRSASAFPLAATCCLGVLTFLVASTIVLALIPVYLPTRGVTPVINNNDDGDEFFVEYAADANPETSQSGSLDNIDEISNRLGFGDDAEITEGFARAVNTRRRRSVIQRRQVRGAGYRLIFRCRYRFRRSCTSRRCRALTRIRTDSRIRSRTVINGVPCAIRTAGVVTRVVLNFRFVGIIKNNFAQFLRGFGRVDSLTFVAIRSGDFNDPSIWLGGIVPFAGVSIVISAGITVSFPRPALTFPLRRIDVFGTIGFGAGSSSFQFNFPTVIAVRGGGVIQDLTSGKRFLFAPGSLLNIFTGGSFASVGTVIQTTTSSGSGSSFQVTSTAGPYTYGILPGGTVVAFPRITFIAIQSGGFTSGGTYLGGEAPSVAACSSGCGISVLPGVTLSTADLNGALTLNIVQIDVALGGRLEFGTRGSNAGFRFSFPIVLNVFGTMAFVGSGGGFLIPVGNGRGSAINIYSGGIFTSTVVTFIQVYNVVTGAFIGSRFFLPLLITGPYFLTISPNGIISISTIGPGGSSTSNPSTVTTVSTSTTSLVPTTPVFG